MSNSSVVFLNDCGIGVLFRKFCFLLYWTKSVRSYAKGLDLFGVQFCTEWEARIYLFGVKGFGICLWVDDGELILHSSLEKLNLYFFSRKYFLPEESITKPDNNITIENQMYIVL